MSVDQPDNIYREQLSSLHHGLALWDPDPVENLYRRPGHVSIGDVGYLDNGAFMRMFNVTLPWDDPSNKLLGEPPEKYERIKLHLSNIRDKKIREGEHYTPHVSKVDNNGAILHEDSLGQMYQCRAQHRGALLSLPHKGLRNDVIPIKVFGKYIRDNVDSWFRWSKKMMLPVEHMEDLILVTGCTLVTSWAAAAFDGHMSVDSDTTTISLEARKYNDGGGAQFFWRNIRGNVEYHNSDFDPNVQEPLPQNQCVFIRGFRAKRAFFRTIRMRAAAEPLPDDPDNRREDKIQVTRIPDGSMYRDPLVGILDYISQKCNEDISAAEDIMAIAHDDDLRLMEGVETLTADAIEKFLHEKQMPLIVENGSAILRDPADNEPPVSHEKNSERPRPAKTAQTNHQTARSSSGGSYQNLKSFIMSSSHGSNEKYSLATVQDNRESPRPMDVTWPSSQGSAGAWDPWAGSYSHQSTSESHSPYDPDGFTAVFPQNPRPIAAALPSQRPVGVQNAWVPFSTTMATEKRKALVIGINYSRNPDSDFRSQHCTVDAYAMTSFLRTNLGFAPGDIRVMTDEMENSWDRPTKENILPAMRELVRDARPGDSFFLYFSGHGVQIKDMDGDESDGLDECICAMDYRGDDPYPTTKTPGLIVDNVMHDILVRPLPPRSRLTAVFDSRHLGTALDLPYVHDSNGVVKPFRGPGRLSVLSQKASYADVVSLSASKDIQRVQETHRGGALRCAFIDSMDNTLSYKALIRRFLEYMEKYGIPQQPQLSTSHEIDTNLPFVV